MNSLNDAPYEEGATCKSGGCALSACSPCTILKLVMAVVGLGYLAAAFLK